MRHQALCPPQPTDNSASTASHDTSALFAKMTLKGKQELLWEMCCPVPRVPEGPAKPAILFRLMVTPLSHATHDTGAKLNFFFSLPVLKGSYANHHTTTASPPRTGSVHQACNRNHLPTSYYRTSRSVRGYMRLSLAKETWGPVKAFQSVCKAYLETPQREIW